jgi:Ketopantoate reductase PanE/ApbA
MSDGEDSPPLQQRVRILAGIPIRKRVLMVVGSNAISAFYSWRLASSKACEVTVVWRRNWQAVQDYGIAFQSEYFGSERWKPARGIIPENCW